MSYDFNEKPEENDENSHSQNDDKNATYAEEEPNENPENNYQNDINSNINNYENSNIPKKNRTLQYYKFLFYAMKTEIKVQDFMKLVNTSNTFEIVIWLLSLILYANTPKNFPQLASGEKSSKYKNVFIGLHIFHIIRGGLGVFFIYKLPKSFQVMENLEKMVDEKLEKTLFNDLIRESMFFHVTEKIKPLKIPIFIYFGLTILNFIFDLIDFLIVLSSLNSAKTEAKVVLLTYLLIAILYITIDLAYVFWTGQLKYVFPKEYLRPIDSVFGGMVDKAMTTFKLKKPKTDVINEAKVQNANGPYVSSSTKNGGVNLLENLFGDTFGVYNVPQEGEESRERKRNDPREMYQSGGVSNDPNSNEQLDK